MDKCRCSSTNKSKVYETFTLNVVGKASQKKLFRTSVRVQAEKPRVVMVKVDAGGLVIASDTMPIALWDKAKGKEVSPDGFL